ncbi:hypothetical protein [uncultured Treponema sp.]|uniref:hypothetical protein n=1 Tax=uncultured Treponema sp. TaxID=162155 RepID=UPI00280B8A92|nr:hypothetical protein [uncultured Treponema sp.]
MSKEKIDISEDIFRNINNASFVAEEDDDLDSKLVFSKKKHRNTLIFFDNLFQSITHPFVLTVLCLIIVVVTLFFRYFSLHCNILWIKKAATDCESFISYFFTVVITYIITEFFENIKRTKDNE